MVTHQLLSLSQSKKKMSPADGHMFNKVLGRNYESGSCEATHVCHNPYLFSPQWELLQLGIQIDQK